MTENDNFVPVDVREHDPDRGNENSPRENENPKVGGDNQPGSNVEAKKAPDVKGPKVVEKFRLHHSVGGTFSDFDSESDLLDFVKDATTVKVRRNPDGSKDNVFSPNSHLVHGAAHPDYPNLNVSRVYSVEFPEDEDE